MHVNNMPDNLLDDIYLNYRMSKNITILGINGGFGALFSRFLSKEPNLIITGVDLGPNVSQSSECSKYIQANISLISKDVKAIIFQSDLILICLPEEITYIFFDKYGNHISKSTLIIDTLSVKSKIATIYLRNDFNALSLNPMFGPDLSIVGKNIAVIKFLESEFSNWFISLLAKWNLCIRHLTSEEHDRLTAYIQVATHSVLIAFGMTLKDSAFSITELLNAATPPFLSLSTFFGRISSGNKNVYWNIQEENTFAKSVRKTLIENLITLDKTIIDGDRPAFDLILDSKTEDQEEFLRLSHLFSSFPTENITPGKS